MIDSRPKHTSQTSRNSFFFYEKNNKNNVFPYMDTNVS